MVKVPAPLAFNWDQGNIEKNWQKHKVYYKEAEEVFFNKPLKILKDVKHSQVEDRFVGLGITNKKRRLYMVFTVRDRKIRVISARDQSNKEREFYEERKR